MGHKDDISRPRDIDEESRGFESFLSVIYGRQMLFKFVNLGTFLLFKRLINLKKNKKLYK